GCVASRAGAPICREPNSGGDGAGSDTTSAGGYNVGARTVLLHGKGVSLLQSILNRQGLLQLTCNTLMLHRNWFLNPIGLLQSETPLKMLQQVQRRYIARLLTLDQEPVRRAATDIRPDNPVAARSAEITPRRQCAIDAGAYAAAIALAGCAAWFSIKGMVVLFPGAPLAVVAMAI